MELTKSQLKYLRKLSHAERPLFQMGKLGLTDAFVEQVDFALEKRELIKFILLQNSSEDVLLVARELEDILKAKIVQVIGSTVILYRPSQKEKYQRISNDLKRQ